MRTCLLVREVGTEVASASQPSLLLALLHYLRLPIVNPHNTPELASPTTHYAVLGLAPSSSLSEIRQAYRSLILIHHPDRVSAASASPSASSTPRGATVASADELNEAWRVLGDEERKHVYDEELRLQKGASSRIARASLPSSSVPYSDSSRSSTHPISSLCTLPRPFPLQTVVRFRGTGRGRRTDALHPSLPLFGDVCDQHGTAGERRGGSTVRWV